MTEYTKFLLDSICVRRMCAAHNSAFGTAESETIVVGAVVAGV